MKFKNDESGYRAFDKAREEKVTEINLRCQELGIGIADGTVQTSRFNALIDYMCGVLEVELDDETGVMQTHRATGDRMQYEMVALEKLLEMVNTAGVQAAFSPATPRKTQTDSGLVLPGGMG